MTAIRPLARRDGTILLRSRKARFMWNKLSRMLSRVSGTLTAGSGRNQRRPRRFRPGIERLEDRAVPATFTVTTTLDAVAADGKLSLREAINAANARLGGDTIVLPAGVYR